MIFQFKIFLWSLALEWSNAVGPLQAQKELIDLERKGSLMEAIMKGTIELQDLTKYPFQKLHSFIATDWS